MLISIVYRSIETAFLRYDKVGKDFELNETKVPTSKRGQGAAEELANVRHSLNNSSLRILSRIGHS